MPIDENQQGEIQERIEEIDEEAEDRIAEFARSRAKGTHDMRRTK